MPLDQLFCGVLSNIHVTMVESGKKGRKPGKTSTGVGAVLWQGGRNLAATNARLNGFEESCGRESLGCTHQDGLQ